MPDDAPLLLLGCGYTLTRVAEQALAAGRRVIATSRHPARLAGLARAGAEVRPLDVEDPQDAAGLAAYVPEGARAVHSVPVLRTPHGLQDPTPSLLAPFAGRLARLVYLSSTGVYGETAEVDEHTPVAPVTELQRLRVAAEGVVRAVCPAWTVLRPAAIYGPGRGVHVMIREGRYRLAGDGGNVVSRIHVDDLAALVTAAVQGDVGGAWPVADDLPAPAAEVAHFVARRLGLPDPPTMPIEDAHETMRITRRVDGRAIRRLLGVGLRYPTYREGIPAALDAEAAGG